MLRVKAAVASVALAVDAALTVLRALDRGAAGADLSPAVLVWLFALRALAVGVLLLLAARAGLGRWPRLCTRGRRASPAAPSALPAPVEMQGSAPAALATGPARSPLLAEALQCEAGRPEGSVVSEQDGDARAQQIDAVVSAQRDKIQSLARGLVVRHVLLFIAFLITVAFSIIAAVTLVSMEIATCGEVRSAIAQVIGLVMMHVEFALLHSVVMEITSGTPVMMPAVHEHALYWTDLEHMGFAMCSMCHQKVGIKTGGFLALQCRTCKPGQYGHGGFQVCTNCYRKRAVKEAEGVAEGAAGSGILRGDKGPKSTSKMTVTTYVRRLLSMMPRSALCAMFVAVIGAKVVGALVPKVQGNCVSALVRSDGDLFAYWMVLFAVLVSLSSLCGLALSVATSLISARLYLTMSVKLYRALLRQDIAFYDNALTGQLTSRLQGDLSSTVSPLSTIVNTFVANVVMLVVGFVICLQSSWRLTVLALTILMPVAHISGAFSKYAALKMATQYTHIADAQGCATQGLTNIRTIRSFGGRHLEEERFEKQMQKAQTVRLQTAWAGGLSSMLNGLVEFGASYMIMFYGGRLALGNTFEVGSIITFTYLWNALSAAVSAVTDNLYQPVRAASAGQRVFEILDLEPDILEESGENFPAESRQIEVELRNVQFAYQRRPDQKVLRGLDMMIAAGKTTAVVGKSGCGKSTLTKLLMRFYDPSAGAVLVNAQDLREFHLLSFRTQLGIVSQDTQLFNLTVSENIAYGLREEAYTVEDVQRAARSANADEFIRALPEGYRTLCGESGHDFSGGQKQRISIARALVRRPRLLVLDEATSALDAENESLVQEALDALMAEMRGACTILVIAHRLSTIQCADRIVVLHEGEKVEEGTHQELLDIKDGRYATMIARQLQSKADA